MTDEDRKENNLEKEAAEEVKEEGNGQDTLDELKDALAEEKNKYIRLYADFENYKKIAARNKEELLKYANEELMTDILTVIDHLELALQHSSEDNADSASLAEGVDLTLKELKNVLEKHGLNAIDTSGKLFDPSIHHAMSQIETDDAEENTVVKEFRKGYVLRERLLRAALVGVAKKPAQPDIHGSKKAQNKEVASDEKQ
jgi:molecular chaperone GrpE